ncbi:hypothetical protein Tco_0615209, partial [Tanacetum coccineum]
MPRIHRSIGKLPASSLPSPSVLVPSSCVLSEDQLTMLHILPHYWYLGSVSKNRRACFADLERNRFRAANFPLKLCISFKVFGDCMSATAFVFLGFALIPSKIVEGFGYVHYHAMFGLAFNTISSTYASRIALDDGDDDDGVLGVLSLDSRSNVKK